MVFGLSMFFQAVVFFLPQPTSDFFLVGHAGNLLSFCFKFIKDHYFVCFDVAKFVSKTGFDLYFAANVFESEYNFVNDQFISLCKIEKN